MALPKAGRKAKRGIPAPWDGPAEIISPEALAMMAEAVADTAGVKTDPQPRETGKDGSGETSSRASSPCDSSSDHYREAAIGDRRRIDVDGDVRWFLNVFDIAEARERLARQESREAPGHRLIETIATDAYAGWRRIPIGTGDMIASLDALSTTMPNFATAITVIRQAVAASFNTMTPLTLEPLILVGLPGTGKSRFCQEVAHLLAQPFHEVAMPNMNGTGTFLGQDPVWRHARPGRIIEALASSRSAAPIFFLDEIEKAYAQPHDQPLDAFHTLWEPRNAKRLRCECTGVSFCGSAVIWLASANSLEDIRPSILDRAQILTIEQPTPAQSRAIIDHIFTEATRLWEGWFTPELPQDAAVLLLSYPPRQMKRILNRALTHAAAEGRKTIDAQDIIAASALGGRKKLQMGFL